MVATPIGNLEDITLRALRVLGSVNLIAAEDTRTTRKLLNAHGIKTPLTSYFERNKLTKLSSILDKAQEGDVALVSEAGMPGISDPGLELIQGAVKREIKVIPIPGASAIATAVAISGFPVAQFIFLGFLPRKRGERRRLWQSLSCESRAIVAFESPHRLLASLQDLAEVWGEAEIVVCRELTKLYEEVFRGTIHEAVQYFHKPRGEFTLVVKGLPKG